MAARQIWDGRIGSAVVQAKNWRLAFFSTAVLCGGMAAGWFWQSERGTVVPWVVQVDKEAHLRGRVLVNIYEKFRVEIRDAKAGRCLTIAHRRRGEE